MLAFLIFTLIAASVPAASAAAQAGISVSPHAPYVEEVRFTGVRALHPDTFRAVVPLARAILRRPPVLRPRIAAGDFARLCI